MLSFGPTAASVARKDAGVFKLFKFLTAGSTQERDVEARDDIEAPAGSSGIALTNLATDQHDMDALITGGEHQIGKVLTRDQVHLSAFAVHIYTFSFSVPPDLNVITPGPPP